MITFIVQARLGSTRLPNKIFLPFFKEETIFSLLVKKLQSIPNTKIIIATTDNKRDDLIQKESEKLEVNCFRGSENDVLTRFIEAAKKYGASKIIRICSDNPFLDRDSIMELVNNAEITKCDYISFSVNGTPSIKTHFGFWAEFVTLGALEKVKELTNESLFHEHVTNYIYAHPEQFNIGWISVNNRLKGRDDIRLTIDTATDFENAKTIYSDLTYSSPYTTIPQIVEYLDNNQGFLKLMKNEIKKNTK